MPLSSFRFSQNLAALRLELSIQRNLRGLTYDDLALASGVSRRALVAIEVGTSRGSVESWLQICEALGTTFSRFMEIAFISHIAATPPVAVPQHGESGPLLTDEKVLLLVATAS
jgi:DNA-binding XRE family transcriptional regulator